MKQPGIDQEAIFRDGEIVAELHFSDASRGVVRVIVPDDLAAKSVRDNARAGSAIAGRVVPAGEDAFIPGEPFEAAFSGVPVHLDGLAGGRRISKWI